MRKIKGFIDQIDQHGISGWVVDQENTATDLYVDVEIGNLKFPKVPCNKVRLDLKKRGMHPTGACGFKIKCLIDKSTPLAAIKASYKDVNLRKSRKLQKARLKLLDKNQNTPILFFIHIPKTAGTSFRMMLSEQIHQTNTYPNEHLIAANEELYPPFEQIFTLEDETLSQLKLISGHYTAVKATLIENRKTLVFLRHPIQRCISHLFHIKLNDQRFQSANISLEQIFTQSKRALNNAQVRHLSTIPCTLKLEEKHLESAKAFLSNCDFVGLTEEFERSIAKFEKQFAFPKKQILQVNTTKSKHKPTIPTSLYEQIVANNQYDMALYDHAVHIFQED